MAPGQSAGAIVAVPPGKVVKALGGSPASFDACRHSRAYFAVDPLQGSRVRIVFRDGVGVESVQPLGSDLSASEEVYLFAAGLVAEPAILDVDGIADSAFSAGWLTPPLRRLPVGPMHVEKGGTGNLLAVRIGPTNASVVPAFKYHMRFAPVGIAHFDPQRRIVLEASVRGEVDIGAPIGSQMLFESGFISPSVLTVDYRCRPL